MPLVGGLKFGDEGGKEAAVGGVAGGVEVGREVATGAAEDFADGGRGKIGDGGIELMVTQEKKNLGRGAEVAAFEGVDVEGEFFEVAADHEVAGQADGFEIEVEAGGDQQINEAERERNAGAAGEDLIEKAVVGVGVVFAVAVKAVFVKEDAVEDATFVASAGGLGNEFPAAGGEGVELGDAVADVEAGADGAGEEQGAGFEFVVERADEGAKFTDGIGELHFGEVIAGVPGVGAVGADGEFAEEADGGGTEGEQVVAQGAVDGRARVVEQA